ncbi:probable assembly chaperone of rpl4 [Anneissia japonica]|uniref:probable assembly chaperone of rpl4 n=1 Tax=Anneissia japonica TaxID=1529436 RepID=UPI001425973F|nr:probable assembly chaperone of rpl4 [Anneissia japonica]
MGGHKTKGKRKRQKRGHAKGENKGVKELTARTHHEEDPMEDGKTKITMKSKENEPKKKAAYSVDQIIDKAEECLDTFNFEMAQKYCQKALEIEPDNVRVLEMTGNMLVEIGDIEGAKKCFGRAVTVCPDSGFAKYMYLGQVFEGQQAIECFTKGIDIMLKERQERNAEESEGACAMTSEGGVSDGDVARAYCSIAEIYLTDSCFEDKAETQCYEHLEKALQYSPHSPEAYQLMASYFLSIESNQQAKEMINKSVSLWLPKLKEVEGSKAAGDKFDPVETCPMSYLSRVGAIKILIEVEEFDVAEEILQMLLEEDDEVVQVWYLLGWLHVLQDTDEDKSYARYFLHKAMKLSQKDEGEYASMIQHTNELLEKLGPGDGDAEDWLEKQILEAVENEDDDDDEMSSDNEEEDMEQ